MSEVITSTKNKRFISIFAVAIFITIILVEYLNIQFFNDAEVSRMFNDSITRLLGGSLFLILVVGMGFNFFNPVRKPFLKSLLIILPALLISIYNFPFIAYFSGTASITKPTYMIYVFLVECLSVGYFEEIVFRGFLLILLLQLFPRTKKGVFLAMIVASTVFGLVHLANIFDGANLFDTLIQIGYSFLMGLLWSVVFVKTKNIWFGIILHALYNFLGLIFFRLGVITGNLNTVTIITTIFIAIAVAIYMTDVFLKIDSRELEELYLKE